MFCNIFFYDVIEGKIIFLCGVYIHCGLEVTFDHDLITFVTLNVSNFWSFIAKWQN